MNKQLADSLQRSLGISQEQIVREEYEMILLKRIFESELGKSFVFKGGTALRLAYGSPRFSEDIDFSVVESFDKQKLNRLFKATADQYEALKLVEVRQKYYTYFALFRVKEMFMTQSFSIKFEASIRQVSWQKNKDYKLLTLNSKVTNLTILAQVVTLDRINQDKSAINPLRIRDIFDLWFIAQKLGKNIPMDFKNWEAKTVKRELHKFLPKENWEVLDLWLKEK